MHNKGDTTMTNEHTEGEPSRQLFAKSRLGIRNGDGLHTRTQHRNSGGSIFTCILCGESEDRFDSVATTLFDGQSELCDLCDACVKAGPVVVGDRIRTHAADLHAQAVALDALAGDLSKVELTRWRTLEDGALALELRGLEFVLPQSFRPRNDDGSRQEP